MLRFPITAFLAMLADTGLRTVPVFRFRMVIVVVRVNETAGIMLYRCHQSWGLLLLRHRCSRFLLFLLFTLLLIEVSSSFNSSLRILSSPLDTFDTERTPQVGLSFAEPVHYAELQIEEAGPEDASVAPWQDRST